MRGIGNGNGMGVRNKKQAFRWSLRGGKRQGSSVAAPESCNLGSARPVMGQGRGGHFRNIISTRNLHTFFDHFLYTLYEPLHYLLNLFPRNIISRSKNTVITPCSLEVRATCKSHNDQSILETSCLQDHRKLAAFEVKLCCIRRRKIKFDAPKHTPTADIKGVWCSNGIGRLQLLSQELRQVLSLHVRVFE
jgi:hypothetical protein